MPATAVVFDLDGTLLDTLHDIAAAANAVLEQNGFPQHSVDAYRYLVGSGVMVLFERALPESSRNPIVLAECIEQFSLIYARCWNASSKPYAGISELLDELSARRVPMAVLSNKPHDFTVLCVQELLSAWEFAAVFGERPAVPRKPDPAAAVEIAATLKVAPERCVYVGDTGVDMETACRAGMIPVGAAWGFRTADELRAAGAQAVIERPAEVLRFFDESMDTESSGL